MEVLHTNVLNRPWGASEGYGERVWHNKLSLQENECGRSVQYRLQKKEIDQRYGDQ